MAIIFGFYKLDRGISRQKGLMDAPGDLQDAKIDKFMTRNGPILKFCLAGALGNIAWLSVMGGSVLSVAALATAIAMAWKVETGERGLKEKQKGLKKAKDAGVAMD